MAASNVAKRFIAPLVILTILALAVGLGFATSDGWMPNVRQFLASLVADAEEEEAHQGGEDPDVLKLSPQASASLHVKAKPLQRSDYVRYARIPGQVVGIPGVTQQEITSKSSGEISQIYVLEGQVVAAGEPLFDISLTHEEAIQSQVELLDALAKLEVVNAEIKRLEDLERLSPGAVAGTKLLTQKYERGHLQHTISSRRQILMLLGLSQSAVEQLMKRHKQRHLDDADSAGDEGDHDKRPLIQRLTVYAPTVEEMPPRSPTTFVMEHLEVTLGQHVDVGSVLCRLGDYRHLYIEGQAFESDMVKVRQAIDKGWTVTVVTEGYGGVSNTRDGLPILYINSTVDDQSRAARFYVELENISITRPNSAANSFADWKFRPGQRVELKIPIELFPNSLVLPLEAIARDGVENYVFQVSGNIYFRRKVTVLNRDEKNVRLADDGSVSVGVSLASSGAHQLQLALRNRVSGPVEHSHGGGAAHSH